MTILLSWLLFITVMTGLSIGFGYLAYKLVTSLPEIIEKYVTLKEKLKRERLKTDRLRMEVLNEQLKDPRKHRDVRDYQ